MIYYRNNIPQKKEPTLRQKMEVLECDICNWIQKNKYQKWPEEKDKYPLAYEECRQEIIATFTENKLSPETIAEYAAHISIRLADANFAMQRERQFEPFVEQGYKKIKKDTLTKNPRKPITEDGKSIERIIEDFVSCNTDKTISAIKLWDSFYNELGRLNLKKLRISNHAKEPNKCSYNFLTFNGKSSQIKFGRFKNIVANCHSKKKSL